MACAALLLLDVVLHRETLTNMLPHYILLLLLANKGLFFPIKLASPPMAKEVPIGCSQLCV